MVLKKKRRAGTLVKGIPAFTKLMPYLMPDKTGSLILFQEDYDVTDAVVYIKELNRHEML